MIRTIALDYCDEGLLQPDYGKITGVVDGYGQQIHPTNLSHSTAIDAPQDHEADGLAWGSSIASG